MIRRFKKILLVARGRSEEQAAVGAAVRLAKENGAELTALRVLQRMPPDVLVMGAMPPALDLEQVAARTAREDLRRALQPAEQQGCRCQVKVAFGTPFIEVIREVLVEKCDLVLLNADSKRSLRRSLFGSMTMRLMRKCPCPIWVVKSEQHAHARILAAIGPPHESEDEGHLNRKIIELASSLAELEQSELHVVHAWDVFAEGILVGRAGVPEDDIRKMGRETRKQAKKLMLNLLSPLGLADHPERIHLIKGSPAVAIPRLVRRKKIDVLVMGTVCRTGVAGFLMGNTAERVLGQVHCSVVTLKPDGFVSPVKVE